MWICEKGGNCVDPCEGCEHYIEVEYVKHGYWRDCFKCVDTCSNCRYTVPKDEYGHKYPYCPHCGAKMDLED